MTSADQRLEQSHVVRTWGLSRRDAGRWETLPFERTALWWRGGAVFRLVWCLLY